MPLIYRVAVLSWHSLLTLLAILTPASVASENGKPATDPWASEYTQFLQLGAHATTAELKMREDLANMAPKPHILFILLDDLGYADFGFNKNDSKTMTPAIDTLAQEGVVLDRHYVHSACSPTRSAIQSGRAPIHVNVLNRKAFSHDPADPVSGYAGIPPNMTGIAEVMRSVGYSTHMVGKWDVGMATPQHTPAAKGYDTSLVYLTHAVDSWTYEIDHPAAGAPCDNLTHLSDLWHHDENIPFPGMPANLLKNVPDCSSKHQHPSGACMYIEQTFENRVKSIISEHSSSKPLFLFWSTKTAHSKYQPPGSEIAKVRFKDAEDTGSHATQHTLRRATITWIDGAIGRVLQTLKKNNMYDHTLIVVTSDNGADITGVPNSHRANASEETPRNSYNYPLKAGKHSNWEGGVRVPAVVSGGFVPKAARGTVRDELVAAWDWYATLARLAGADSVDMKAVQAGLPPHDSIDQWPMIAGANSKRLRTRIEIGQTEGYVEGLIIRPYKLLINNPGRGFVTQRQCGYTPETGCLYDVFADPGETRNLAKQKPEVFGKLLKELVLVNRTMFSPRRVVHNSPGICNVFATKYGGFLGPFL